MKSNDSKPDFTDIDIINEKPIVTDEMHNGTDSKNNLYFKMAEYNYHKWANENPNRHGNER